MALSRNALNCYRFHTCVEVFALLAWEPLARLGIPYQTELWHEPAGGTTRYMLLTAADISASTVTFRL